jgi:hypothetical protein
VAPTAGASRPNALGDGISPSDLDKATLRGDIPILGIRYASDWRCPAARFERLAREFGPRFYRMDVNGKGHSTLGHSFCSRAFDEVAGFLDHFVREGPAPTPRPFPVLAKNNSPTEVRVTCHDQHS